MEVVYIILGVIIMILLAYRYKERENENFNITLNTILITLFGLLLVGYLLYMERKSSTKKERESLYRLYESYRQLNCRH